MLPFNFAVHKTSESFIGNGSTRVFAFTQIPAITKTDIQLLIYNQATLTQTIIDYADFDFVLDSSYIGFTITLGTNITTPTTSDILIAKLARVVKNDAVFPDGSSPSPRELTIGYQGLCLSMATIALSGSQSSLLFPISDVLQNLSSLTLPQIDTSLSKLLLALRKNTDNKYELYYDSSIIDNIYNVNIKEIDNDYILTESDNIILFKSTGTAGKKITLYRHLNIQAGYSRYIEIRNESNNDLDVEYNSMVIDTVPALTTCQYKIDSSAQYVIVS